MQLPADTFPSVQQSSQSSINNMLTTSFLCADEVQETCVPQACSPDGIIRLRQITDLPNKNTPENEADWINLCHIIKLPNNAWKPNYTNSSSSLVFLWVYLVRAEITGFWVFFRISWIFFTANRHCWELLSCLSMKMMKAHIYAFMLSYSLFNYHWGWFVTLKQFWGSQGSETAQNENAISPSTNGRHDTHLTLHLEL